MLGLVIALPTLCVAGQQQSRNLTPPSHIESNGEIVLRFVIVGPGPEQTIFCFDGVHVALDVLLQGGDVGVQVLADNVERREVLCVTSLVTWWSNAGGRRNKIDGLLGSAAAPVHAVLSFFSVGVMLVGRVRGRCLSGKFVVWCKDPRTMTFLGWGILGPDKQVMNGDGPLSVLHSRKPLPEHNLCVDVE
ncbi:hypothetical protein FN846DRAFT_908103 [Sphaerosporella brunnea]|uniref:Secreted protein n=1 Tax=Sphaerosporella brunnea TaxID=1250544 RepID=A0A5J5EUA4_9PEZI|nr:hypothetical protein FN846DRAFT_908103 [Sphaerosporella brunnea]